LEEKDLCMPLNRLCPQSEWICSKIRIWEKPFTMPFIARFGWKKSIHANTNQPNLSEREKRLCFHLRKQQQHQRSQIEWLCGCCEG
jgi:hypothetical protein